ncbi:MAG: Crp/Fnr family transcriptional regulator [Enterococcus sp.]
MQVNSTQFHFSKLRYTEDFENFTDEEFQLLKENVLLRSYKKGQILFDEGDSRNRVYFLTKGLVRLERYDESATYYYYDYVPKKTLFPTSGLFEECCYTYTAQALTDIETFYLPIKLYERLSVSNPKQLLYLVRHIGKIVENNELRIQIGLTSSAFDRVKQNLYILQHELGEPTTCGKTTIPYPITLKELAVNSGTTRETAGQVVRQMREEGLIDYDKKQFTFNDPLYLETFA